MSHSLAEIDALTKQYAQEREELAARVTRLNEIIERVKNRLLPGIKSSLVKTKSTKEVLAQAIDDSRELFVKPKSVVFHGVKVGLLKSPGRVEWDDKEKVISLIEKHFGDQAETLVKVTKSPIRKALVSLQAADLKKIGVRLVETGDTVVIKPIDTDVDKIVSALLGETNGEDEEE